jgi:hypothetical protein
MAKQKVVNVFDELMRLVEEAKLNLAEDYAPVPAPELRVDKKKGTEYLGKGSDTLNKTILKARQAAQKEIDAGNYDPFFPVEQRYQVDPTNYPLEGNTLIDTLPKKAETIAKKKAELDTPAARAALNKAYDAAAGDPLAHNWYAMGQLEQSFIDTFGEEMGRKLFKERFADAMAATTGGMDPTSNLVAAQYGNFMQGRGLTFPEAAYEMATPVGGRYISGNAKMYNKITAGQSPMTAAGQPKRFNFSANFLGHQGPATIDEQMTMGMTGGKMAAPPQGGYGIMENIVADEAAKRGLPGASNMQDVAWAGFKNAKGKPMIEIVNEAIERTARITGQSAAEVVDNYKKGMPLFGVGGATVITYDALMGQGQEVR